MALTEEGKEGIRLILKDWDPERLISIWDESSAKLDRSRDRTEMLLAQSPAGFRIYELLASDENKADNIFPLLDSLFLRYDQSFESSDRDLRETECTWFLGYVAELMKSASQIPAQSEAESEMEETDFVDTAHRASLSREETLGAYRALLLGLELCPPAGILHVQGASARRSGIFDSMERYFAQRRESRLVIRADEDPQLDLVARYILNHLEEIVADGLDEQSIEQDRKRRYVRIMDFEEDARIAVLPGYREKREAAGKKLDDAIDALDIGFICAQTGLDMAELARIVPNRKFKGKYLLERIARVDPVLARRYMRQRGEPVPDPS